jgi:Bifunctional DNA primase/polymerase, N-terminal
MPDTLADAALLCATRGFPVGPCCRPTATGCSYAKHAKETPCKFPGKAPILYRGVQGYTTDPEKIAQLFRWYPTANYGVAMGRVSGHFTIESDGPQGEAFLRTFHIPPTPTVVSARGPHRWLKIPAGYVVKTAHIGELDVIGDGDQVIGAGSLHVSGHTYHWQEYLSLEDVDPIEPPEGLRLWLVQRGILQVCATPLTRPTQSNRRKAAASARAQRDEQRGVISRGAKPGKASGGVTAGGGSKTRASPTTPRLVTPLAEIAPVYPRLVTPVWDVPLADLAKKPELVEHIVTFVGLGAVAREVAHLCTLHRERHPSAVLTTGDNGFPVYLDLHAEETDLKAYTMPDYYRARLLGRGLRREEKLKGPSLMPWWERMLVEMGVLAPVQVPHRPLPESAMDSVRQVYEQFLYLCGCKWIYEPDAPTTFSVRFGREWCGIGSHTTFLQARHLLIAHRYIEELPPIYSKDGQRLELYRPAKE